MSELSIIKDFLESCKKQIEKNHHAAGQKVTGKTINSLEVVMNEKGGALMAWKFFDIVETGRKPGKVPYGFAALIMKWAKDKGLNVDNSFGYFVAKKIREEGSSLYRQGGRKDIFSNVLSDENTDKLQDEIGRSIESELFGLEIFKN